MMRSILCLALAATGLAAPLELEERAGPSVTIQNGTVTGKSSGGIDTFNGVPFAKPPVGPLRLRQPQPLTAGFPSGSRSFDATQDPPSCPNFILTTNALTNLPSDVVETLMKNPFFQTAKNPKEDCLTINIQRPAGTTADAKLPVLFWIYGGAFELGSNGMYDGTELIKSGMALGKPVLFVAVNYRLNGFGFLAGKELSATSDTNLGLRDQRAGLAWVAENIAAFGGDPDKVTIWGESAGAVSVCDQTIINGGDHTYKGKPLFRAAIMNSGSVVPATETTSFKAQGVYNTVVANSPCAGNANTLECLRALPYNDFFQAVTSLPSVLSYNSPDLAYLPRPDPSDNFFSASPETVQQTGKFARVPVIIGDQEDEGTLFSLFQLNITTNAQLIDYLTPFFPANPNARQAVTGLLAQYPDQPFLGQPANSPFRTGGLNSLYPQYKRIAAVLGDTIFNLSRRVYLDFITKSGVPAWTYLSTYLYGTPLLGTLHASDVAYNFFMPSNSTVPGRGLHTYFINFAYTPENGPNSADNVGPIVNWPQWQNSSLQMINFGLNDISYIADNYRMGAYNYIKANGAAFRV